METKRLNTSFLHLVKVILMPALLLLLTPATLTSCTESYYEFYATLDGEAWIGPVNYELSEDGRGKKLSLTSVNNEAAAKTGHSYTIQYKSGGPQSAVFQGISVSGAVEDDISGDTYTGVFPSSVENDGGLKGKYNIITFNFTTTSVVVDATIDGQRWSGPISYKINGITSAAGSAAPQVYHDLSSGVYSLAYISGGPENAGLQNITPPAVIIKDGQTGTFTFNFVSAAGKITADAGAATQPGGLENAVLNDNSPEATQTVTNGGEATYTSEYISNGDITVKGIVLTTEWRGSCEYTLTGPVTLTGSTLPQTFKDVPGGEYTLHYVSGGPDHCIYYPTEPETKILPNTGETLYFNMHFYPDEPYSIYTSAGTSSRAMADLSLTVSAHTASVLPSGNILYTITITNSGPSVTTENHVRVTLASGISATSSTASTGTYASSQGYWDMGSIDVGVTETLLITAQVAGTAPAGSYTTTAEIVGAEINGSPATDPDSEFDNHDATEDDQGSATVTVLSAADLELALSTGTATVETGTNLVYTIAVQNKGMANATNVEVRFLINDYTIRGISPGYPDAGTYDIDASTWSIPSINSGQTVTLEVYIYVMPGTTPGTHIIKTAEIIACDVPDPDSVPDNNNAGEDDQKTNDTTVITI